MDALRLNRFLKKAELSEVDCAFPILWTLPRLHCLDHVHALLDHQQMMVLILTSPYGDPLEHEGELTKHGIPFRRLPSKWSPYSAETTSFILTYPPKGHLLNHVMRRLR